MFAGYTRSDLMFGYPSSVEVVLEERVNTLLSGDFSSLLLCLRKQTVTHRL